jgi:hypothetical protein
MVVGLRAREPEERPRERDINRVVGRPSISVLAERQALSSAEQIITMPLARMAPSAAASDDDGTEIGIAFGR